MPNYNNGYISYSDLTTFARGHNSTDGDWDHSLSPATYARHLELVRIAKARTGRDLAISSGWSAYRPYQAQVLARKIHGNGAATPGTSSHGGFWEGKQTLAMDYGNWAWVYQNHGGQNQFFADARAAGLTPGMIMRSRGYPDEPWHVIDLNPWSGVPAYANNSKGFLMALSDQQQQDIYNVIVGTRARAGGEMSGEVNLAGIIAWYDHNNIQLMKALQSIQAVTVGELDREGGKMGGKVSLRTFLQWSDNNNIVIREAIAGLPAEIAKSINANLAAGVKIDEKVIKDAVTSALTGTTLNVEAIAKAVNDDAAKRLQS